MPDKLWCSVIAFIVIAFLTSSISGAQGKSSASPDVLIVYSSGVPFKTISEITDADVDALTLPTPEKENVKTIAQRLGDIISKKHHTVRVTEASGITHCNEILDARLVIIGSPSYFGNVSWEIKKFFDIFFHRIYASGKVRFGGKRIAAFSMAEIEPSARQTLTAIERAVNDCRGTFGPTMIVLTKNSEQEIQKRIEQLATDVASDLK